MGNIIIAEVISFGALIAFGLMRYLFDKRLLSTFFIFLFIGINFFEASIAWYLYQYTGEIGDFQIIITIFILYACTFGIRDFKKLDRSMRKRIGKWRGKQLLSQEEISKMERQQDPKRVTRNALLLWGAHVIVFLFVQLILILTGDQNGRPLIDYVTDLSWLNANDSDMSPYSSEFVYTITQTWMLILFISTIWSWSYVIFPPSKK